MRKANDMKRYVAFLRGINLSGNNKIAMSDLKKVFSDMGFVEVSTILNSGNVLFSSDNEDRKKISRQISDMILDVFGYEVPVCIVERDHIKDILDHTSTWWDTDDKARYHNPVFILTDESADDICKLIGEPSEGKEQIAVFENVIFWSYDLSCYQKCNWWKRTATKGIAEKLTIRTGNTIKKICR